MQIEPLTLQAFLNSQWQDITTLDFSPDYRLTELRYLYDLSAVLQDNQQAVSINFPVSLFAQPCPTGWFAFLDDIIPSGASRRYWLAKLDIAELPLAQQNYLLLKKGAIAPVGNLRVKQAAMQIPAETPRLFELAEVINRSTDFLEYANQRGAMAGGATGAGGEAPKLLLRQNHQGQVWIDNSQHLCEADDYYLVKFPRGKRSPIDCDILRAEFYYYHELHALGVATIATDKMRLIEGERYPSLWLPRFDIYQDPQGNTQRYAMESVYSMQQKGTGALLEHGSTIRHLCQQISQSFMAQSGFEFDRSAFVLEWVKRDLLNIAFGNSDNHGRNSAFLRDDKRIWLSPVYDFAPMKADPEGIPRTITWNSRSDPPLELGGEYRFDKIAESLADLCDPQWLLNELKPLANQLVDLAPRLAARGVPPSILTYPTFDFACLPEKLKRWRLI